MTLWLDAHISPAVANWIRKEFDLEVWPLRDLGLSRASDELIFRAAQGKDIVFITKDSDFVTLQSLKGPPPKIILLALGNTSNSNLMRILRTALPKALELLQGGEVLVEISEQ